MMGGQSSPEGGPVARRRSGVRRDVSHAYSGRPYAAVCSAEGGGKVAASRAPSPGPPASRSCSDRGRAPGATRRAWQTSPHRLLRCGTIRTYAGCGFSSGEDMASVAAIANSRLTSRSRATRRASSGSSYRTAGAFSDRFSICLYSLSHSRSAASAPVEGPLHYRPRRSGRVHSTCVRGDCARAGSSSPSTTARSVTLSSAGAASEQESPPPMDLSRDRRQRGPPRLLTPPTAAGADQSTSWTEATTLRPGRSRTSSRPRSVLRSGRCAKEVS